MTKYGCCDIRTWPPRSALQEARNTTADQVHQHQHLCWASIHDECTERHGRPSENGRFLAMLRQVHNTSSILLRNTTERRACMWKEDTVSCHVTLSALAWVDWGKEGYLTEKRSSAPKYLGLSDSPKCTTETVRTSRWVFPAVWRARRFGGSVVFRRSQVGSQRQRNLAESLKFRVCIRKIPGSRLVPYTTIRNKHFHHFTQSSQGLLSVYVAF